MPYLNLFLQLVELYVGYLLLVAAHEGGHWLALVYARYPWHECQIGPLLIRPHDSSRRLSFSGTVFGGKIKYFKNPKTVSFRNELFVIMGGIVMNILIGSALSTVFFRLPSEMQNSAWQLPTLSVFSYLCALGSFIPMRRRALGLDSDGLQLLKLIADGPGHGRRPKPPTRPMPRL